MKLRLRFERNRTNRHGTQKSGDPWNQEMICGPKLAVVDLLDDLRRRQVPTRAVFYKRFIYYLPSGRWWNFDLALVRSIRWKGDSHAD